MYPVIIVEDEEILLNGLAAMVDRSSCGFRVAGRATNGEAALEIIPAITPSLVITDIRMPKMDGLALTERLREEMPDTKVIIVTGYSDFTYAQQAIRLGVADFLLKPVKQEDLVRALTCVKRMLIDQSSNGLNLMIQPAISSCFEDLIRDVQLADGAKLVCDLEKFWKAVEACEPDLAWHIRLQVAASLLELAGKRFQEVLITSDMHWLDGLYEIANNDQKQLQQYLREQLACLGSKLSCQRNASGRQAIGKAKDYIREHFADELSLKEVAEAVYLNPSYFSQIFKEATGENFINYLTRVRIDNAMELLKQSELKVYEVALAVGYSDQAYFSRIFKQVVGVNPIEYRRRLGL